VNVPATLKYTKEHEWTKIEGSLATIGITDHAQSALGDVVFVDLPKVGRTLKVGEVFGTVESIKAVSDLYSPLTGIVKEVNSALTDEPGSVNHDPYGKAWMIKLEVTDQATLATLMDASAYSAIIK
jgi:glycine cleavage system H protein